jgi:hypothetical protein
VSRFLQAGALHRLYLTVAPIVVGDGLPGVRFPGSDRMRDALRPPVRRFILGEDVLFELDLAGWLPAAAASASTQPRTRAADQRTPGRARCVAGHNAGAARLAPPARLRPWD